MVSIIWYCPFSAATLRVFLWVQSFLALHWCASRWNVQWPPGDIRQEVSTSTRSQVAEVSWSGNCFTPVSWELSLALQTWAFHTSWTVQAFEHLLIHWPHQLTISCTQNSQYRWLHGVWLWGYANCEYSRSQHAIRKNRKGSGHETRSNKTLVSGVVWPDPTQIFGVGSDWIWPLLKYLYPVNYTWHPMKSVVPHCFLYSEQCICALTLLARHVSLVSFSSG